MARVTIREFLSRLHGVKESSKGGWKSLCPAHEDKNPSLSISEGDDGRVLLKCHAGCDPERVLEAVGLSWSDFYDHPTAGARRDITYDYHDEHGNFVYQVVRMVRNGEKTFRQRCPDGAGGWNWSMKGIQRVPYRLPAVIEAVRANRWVVIVEGEKDVDRLTAADIVATCNPGGANSWRPEFSDWLRGARVAVIPDNDEAGRDHADNVIQSLDGVAAEVRRVELPDLPPRGDVSDFLDLGGTIDDVKAAIQRAPIVCERWRPIPLGSVATDIVEKLRTGEWRKSQIFTSLRSLHPMGAGWHRKEMIVIAGRPSHGKSTILRSTALQVARKVGPVLYFSLEDSPEQVAARLVCYQAEIPMDCIDESLGGPEAKWVADALDAFERVPLMFDLSPEVDVVEVRARAHEIHQSSGPLAAVFFDYLQLAPPPPGEKFHRRDLEVGHTSRNLKMLSRELNIAVVVAAQLNRAAESRTSRRPRVADIRESGSIEQDADKIYLIHRHDMTYDMDAHVPEEVKGVIEVELGKNRNGPTGRGFLRIERGVHLWDMERDFVDTYRRAAKIGGPS